MLPPHHTIPSTAELTWYARKTCSVTPILYDHVLKVRVVKYRVTTKHQQCLIFKVLENEGGTEEGTFPRTSALGRKKLSAPAVPFHQGKLTGPTIHHSAPSASRPILAHCRSVLQCVMHCDPMVPQTSVVPMSPTWSISRADISWQGRQCTLCAFAQWGQTTDT
jgi:hypothetical protein